MKEKIKLKCISIARDGGSKQYISADTPKPKSLEEANALIESAYYLDNAFGSETRGKFFNHRNKETRVELDKADYEFDR